MDAGGEDDDRALGQVDSRKHTFVPRLGQGRCVEEEQQQEEECVGVWG